MAARFMKNKLTLLVFTGQNDTAQVLIYSLKTDFLLPIFSVYSLDGIVVFSLLVICTCAYMKRVPRLKSFFLTEKKGFFGIFYKGQYSMHHKY
jgi:hypothetical protein